MIKLSYTEMYSINYTLIKNLIFQLEQFKSHIFFACKFFNKMLILFYQTKVKCKPLANDIKIRIFPHISSYDLYYMS